MRSASERKQVWRLLSSGLTDGQIAARTNIPRTTVRDWRLQGRNGRRTPGNGRPCPICRPDASHFAFSHYAYLLGLYLGDGCISAGARTYALRLFLDAAYPGIVVEARAALEAVRPRQLAWARLSSSSRCYVVQMYSNHWPCLFPQHGPGRKHERAIVLADWQEKLVAVHTRELIRGLIHSDGCRVVANDRGVKSVRYHFSNKSEDIKAIYCAGLDALGVRWTRPCARQIAVYRKASVAILDEFVGPKR